MEHGMFQHIINYIVMHVFCQGIFNLKFSTTAQVSIFCSCVVGDDALHRPAVLTSATSSRMFFSWFEAFHCRGGLHFLFAQKMKQKKALKNYVLDNLLMPTHSQYDRHKRIFEPLTQSTLKNTFHSLRQYLECNFIFGYTSRLLLYSRLYCSLANQFFLDLLFTYCSLEYRIH